MANFSTLEIGKKALIAQKFGLDVTANNIANVNTPGYSRRNAVLSEDTSVQRNGFFLGNSVVVKHIQSFRSEYYDREIRSLTSRNSSFDIESQLLKRIETVLGEPSGDDLDTMITDFFKAFEQAAQNPESVTFRAYIIDKAAELTGRFNRISSDLNDLRREAQTSLNSSVKSVNSLLKDISDLNRQASYNNNTSGDSSQQYIDARELKLQELSKFIDIKVTNNQDSTINVFVNGINLVSGIYYSELGIDDTSNEGLISLSKTDISNGSLTELNVQSGEIFSNLKVYNELLNPNTSNGVYSISSQFNDFTKEFANKINNALLSGYGLNDNDLSAPPNGRLFFYPQDTSNLNAGNISINPFFLTNPSELPLSSLPAEPGNTDIARLVASLVDDKTFSNNLDYKNLTPIEYYSLFVSKVGNYARESLNGLENSKLAESQLSNMRESIMGVNLDEEAVNLIKYQKGFEAASRIINVTNELLGTLINLGK